MFGVWPMAQNMPPDWRFNFLDYNGLKRYLKENSTAWSDSLEDKFVGMLEDELKKVCAGPNRSRCSSHSTWVLICGS